MLYSCVSTREFPAPEDDVLQNVFIGPAGWQYNDWVGPVYPRRPGKHLDALAFVASYFDLIEINSTFYRVPSTNTVRSWARRVVHRPNLRFTAKLHRTASHTTGPLSTSDLRVFARSIAPLAEAGRLACILAQFPWSFRNTREARARIEGISAALRPIPVAVEVRHGSWKDYEGCPQEITVCGIDQPITGHSLAPGTGFPGEAGYYLRLHGRNQPAWFRRGAGRDERYNYYYTANELAPWVRRIQSVACSGQPVHVVLNNHFRGQAVANALDIASVLAGGPVDAPDTIREAFPALKQVTRHARADMPSQRSLFTNLSGRTPPEEGE